MGPDRLRPGKMNRDTHATPSRTSSCGQADASREADGAVRGQFVR